MSIHPGPVTKTITVSCITGPFSNISIKVLILVEFNRNTIEPLKKQLSHLGIYHTSYPVFLLGLDYIIPFGGGTRVGFIGRDILTR